jgi:hypothetical protein
MGGFNVAEAFRPEVFSEARRGGGEGAESPKVLTPEGVSYIKTKRQSVDWRSQERPEQTGKANGKGNEQKQRLPDCASKLRVKRRGATRRKAKREKQGRER